MTVPHRCAPSFCSGHGACNSDGTCTCQPAWTSAEDCSVEGCVGDCGENGKCDMETKKCVCSHGYSGSHCERASCLNDCSNRTYFLFGFHTHMLIQVISHTYVTLEPTDGICKDHRCECNAGYTSADCSVKTCTTSCGIHGTCDNGSCSCDDVRVLNPNSHSHLFI